MFVTSVSLKPGKVGKREKERLMSRKLKATLCLLAPTCCLVCIVTWREVRADDPPAQDPGVLVVLDQVTPAPDLPEPTDAVIVTGVQEDFDCAVDALANAGLLTGVGLITQDAGALPPPVGQVQVSATVYDQATLDYWAQTQYVPAFINEVEVTEIPSVQEAVFDLDISAPDADGVIWDMKVRVRRSDGAAAVVSFGSTRITQLPQDAILCNAGPWWHRGEPGYHLCCEVQHAICTVVRQLLGSFWGPIVCGSCETCYQQCANCSGNNPCHSCDPCGLMWILCHWFGHC
jgi:hypothetical protein